MTTPKVFISYSHDSEEHKAWVADLARFLISNGIDVVIDAWNLRRGEDIPPGRMLAGVLGSGGMVGRLNAADHLLHPK